MNAPAVSNEDSEREEDEEDGEYSMALVIPPKKPLSLDILLYIVGFLWQFEDIFTLKNIRRTSRTMRHSRIVLKQLIFAYTDRRFNGSWILAKFCTFILRRPREYPPLLTTLKITGNIHDHSSATQPCVCIALIEVLRQSSALATVEIAKVESLLSVDLKDNLSRCLSALPSLRSLTLDDRIGSRTLRMVRHMRPGLRILHIIDWDSEGRWNAGDMPLLSSLSSLRPSLEIVGIHLVHESLPIDISDPSLVWPRVHTVDLTCVHLPAPELCHAFPNLRVWRECEVEHNALERDDIRARSRNLGLSWKHLDTVQLGMSGILAKGLTCRVRRVETGTLGTNDEVALFLEDIRLLQPSVLQVGFSMMLDLPVVDTPENHEVGSAEATSARDILQDLPRLKTLILDIEGHGMESVSIEAVDDYLDKLISSLNTPILELLELNLIMHRQFSPWPLGKQLEERMHDAGRRALVSALALAAPRLRYVRLNGWFGRSRDAQYWEITRSTDTSMKLRTMDEAEGEQLLKRYKEMDA